MCYFRALVINKCRNTYQVLLLELEEAMSATNAQQLIFTIFICKIYSLIYSTNFLNCETTYFLI